MVSFDVTSKLLGCGTTATEADGGAAGRHVADTAMTEEEEVE